MNFVNFWLCAGLLCLVGGPLAEAWVAHGNYHNDAHPGKCVISDTIILSPGEKAKSPESCSEILCVSEEGDVKIVGCGAIGPPKGCKWGDHVNRDAPFQECCARHLVCDGGLTDENRIYEQRIWDRFSRNSKKVIFYARLCLIFLFIWCGNLVTLVNGKPTVTFLDGCVDTIDRDYIVPYQQPITDYHLSRLRRGYYYVEDGYITAIPKSVLYSNRRVDTVSTNGVGATSNGAKNKQTHGKRKKLFVPNLFG